MKLIKITRSLLLTALAVAWLFTNSFAQTGTSIFGRLQTSDGAPAAFANVLLMRSADSTMVKGTLTDSIGNYEFNRIIPGNYFVKASLIGMGTTATSTFVLNENQAKMELPLLQFYANALNLNEVTVRSTKPFIERQADRFVLNVENSVVNAGGTVMEILEKAPGVSVDNNDDISIQGKQGIIVLIDGKQTPLTGADLAALLRSTPSQAVDKVEIITNPFAKFDAAGTAGVINILYKKSDQQGYFLAFTLTRGAGWNEKLNPGVNGNFRSGKLNLFGNYSYNDAEASQSFTLNRTIGEPNQFIVFDQYANYRQHNREHFAQFGADFSLNKTHTIGFLSKGQFRETDDAGQSVSDFLLNNELATNQLRVLKDADSPLSNYAFNVNYRGAFGKTGGNLNADADYIYYNIKDQENFAVSLLEFPSNAVLSQQQMRNLTGSDIRISAFKLDYEKPLAGNARLEAGLKYSLAQTENDIQFDSLSNGDWTTDFTKTNAFEFDEKIAAGYLQINKISGKLEFRVGLRVEHTNSDGYSLILDQRIKRDYLNWFPSAAINWTLREQQKLGISYSRRIDRPSYQRLNPFVFFVDPFTFVQGNSFLQAQYTDNIELSFSTGKFNFSAGYSHTTEAMSFVTKQIDSLLTGIATYANLDHLYNAYFNVNQQWEATKWWTMFNYATVFYNRNKSEFEGATLDNDLISFGLSMNQNFTLPWGFRAELSFNYRSPMAAGIGKSKDFYLMNAGLQKSFDKNRLRVRLAFNDVLNSNIFQGRNQFQTQDLRFSARRRQSRFLLTLTYSLGDNKLGNARRRRSSAEDETKRVILDN
ncbi:MAG: TonB-dependent receptor [Saprospiraceae bacterium]|nr:TonB-dependent receptor [Saprospiraceae bacterium]